MKATIVIPNINGKGWLKDSIESVYAQTEQDFELIIVDNGSTDESLEQARSYCGRPNFTLIENGTNTGFSHAVNQGIARARGEYVVMFNNDAFAEPGWLDGLCLQDRRRPPGQPLHQTEAHLLGLRRRGALPQEHSGGDRHL